MKPVSAGDKNIELEPSAAGSADDGPVVPRLADEDRDLLPIVEAYVPHLRGQVAEMERAWQAGDLPSLRRIVHQVKGSAGSNGFDDFSGLARQIEQRIACGDELQVGSAIDRMQKLAERIKLPLVLSR